MKNHWCKSVWNTFSFAFSDCWSCFFCKDSSSVDERPDEVHLRALRYLHAVVGFLAIARTRLRPVVEVTMSACEHSRNGWKERNGTVSTSEISLLSHESICRLKWLFWWLMSECLPRRNRVSEEEEQTNKKPIVLLSIVGCSPHDLEFSLDRQPKQSTGIVPRNSRLSGHRASSPTFCTFTICSSVSFLFNSSLRR